MLELAQPLLQSLTGVALFLYGAIHLVTRYPGGQAFSQFLLAVPDVLVVLLFALGFLAVISGVLLLVKGVRGVRQHWRELDKAISQRKPRITTTYRPQPPQPSYADPDDEDAWYAEAGYR